MTMFRVLLLVVALCGMAACVLAPIFYFFGRIDVNTYQDSFLAGSVIWFVFATWWGAKGKRKTAAS